MNLLAVFIIGMSISATWPALAGDGGLAGDDQPRLENLTGVYRGHAPTDESALATGEIEATITNDKIQIRMATGLRIEEGEVPLAGFVPMTREEIEGFYRPGSGFLQRSFGFRGPSGYPQLVFLRNPSVNWFFPGRSEYGLIVKTGGMQDMLGPTVLLTPKQLEKVSCERYLRSYEFWAGGSWSGGLIPRLDTDGRAPRDFR